LVAETADYFVAAIPSGRGQKFVQIKKDMVKAMVYSGGG